MTLYVCHCGPGGRWWQPTTGFITACCHLQVDCLESGISSGLLHSTRVLVPLSLHCKACKLWCMLSLQWLSVLFISACIVYSQLKRYKNYKNQWRLVRFTVKYRLLAPFNMAHHVCDLMLCSYCCMSVTWCFTGGFACTMPTVLVELNGIENILKSIAIWTLAVGTGCLLGTPFSGICWQKQIFQT